ncbi:MAG: SDR family oxidoreductase [Myxococcota bacterium]
MKPFDPAHWALILGGSSGFGLAVADKVSRHGMNVAIVHRDRRGAMGRIQPAFDAIAARGVGFRTWNLDALSVEGREKVLTELAATMGTGRVRLLLHSIAFGNLRPLAVTPPQPEPLTALATALEVPAERVREAVAALTRTGHPTLAALAPAATLDPAAGVLEEEDFARTIHAMGTSLITWVQALLRHKLFASDARVVALTSEGNRVAWPGYAAVAAAKGALESAVRSLAAECALHGIRTNVVQAGVTETPALSLIPGHQRILAAAQARNPFRRMTTPEDVAAFICLLATDEAAWVTGAHIMVDGGEHLG